MIFQRIESEGIAHYSYLIGDGHDAAVIDPRFDCDVYIEEAHFAGLRIRHIFETHRHEDFVLGSAALAGKTSAEIWHADSQWPYKYGQAARQGQKWSIGRLTIEALSSPGHTPGSMSYLLRDPNGNAWVVFTGDALFAGDVGRVDFLGMDEAPRMAGLLYNTIFETLLPLGDGVIVCPAHGAGSVCASDISERMWTTIGLERLHNPKLQVKDRNEFISLTAKKLEYPPYFRLMEKLNLEGPQFTYNLPLPLSVSEFVQIAQDAVIVDTRTEVAFGASHVPGSLFIWLSGIPAFAGWFLPYDRPILLVNETDNPNQVVRYLARLGYNNIAGFLAGGMLAWQTAGYESSTIRTTTVQEFCSLIDQRGLPWLLDVRSLSELNHTGRLRGAYHIHLTELQERMDEVPKDKPVYIFCASGLRSMVAASFLKRAGWQDLTVVLGGLAGWKSVSCPIRK